MAAFPRGGSPSRNGAAWAHGYYTPCGPNLHSTAFDVAVVDAPDALLGMYPRGTDYFSFGFRVDLIPNAAYGSRDVCCAGLRLSCAVVSSAYAPCGTLVPWSGYLGISGSRWKCSFVVEAFSR